MTNVTDVYAPIVTAFATEVATAVGSVVVVASNDIYKPLIGTPYVKTYLLPIEHTDRDVLGTDFWETIEGFFQVSVFTPAGRGTAAADAITDDLFAHFVSGKRIDTGEFNLRIIRAWRTDSLEETDWYGTPVRIRWTAELPRELS